MNRIALVTGANRGLGLATAKKLLSQGYHVVLAARHLQSLEAEIPNLKKIGGSFDLRELDVSQNQNLAEFCKAFLKDFKNIHVLVNNAGVLLDRDEKADQTPMNTTKDTLVKTLTTNTFAPLLLIQGFLPKMIEQNYGRIVNVSSGMGELTAMEGNFLSYRMSKTSLNVITRVFSKELQGKDILINSVCPGWVKTDMGGAGATRSLDEGISGIVWAATIPAGGPTGGFFRDGKPLDW